MQANEMATIFSVATLGSFRIQYHRNSTQGISILGLFGSLLTNSLIAIHGQYVTQSKELAAIVSAMAVGRVAC